MSDIAQLSMYDLPAMRPAVDAWWAGLARHLRRVGLEEVPAVLTRNREMEEVARSPDLLLMQTCGYPLLYRIGDAVRLLATPVYAAEGRSFPGLKTGLSGPHPTPTTETATPQQPGGAAAQNGDRRPCRSRRTRSA